MVVEVTYTARRDAGPSKAAVIPSTVTTPGSLPTYLESPLLYSFPVILQNSCHKAHYRTL